MNYLIYFTLIFFAACDLDTDAPEPDEETTDTEESEEAAFDESSVDDSSSTEEEPSSEPSEAETSEESETEEPETTEDPETAEDPETLEDPETPEDPETSEDPADDDCGLFDVDCGDSSSDTTETIDPKQCFDECHDENRFDTMFAECDIRPPSICLLEKCRAQALAARNESYWTCGSECKTITPKTRNWYRCRAGCGKTLSRCTCQLGQIESVCRDNGEICFDWCDEELRGRRPAGES